MAFLLLALLACMALALGVIAFFAIDAVRDGRRFLNASGERIVAQAMDHSQNVLGKGRERIEALRARDRAEAAATRPAARSTSARPDAARPTRPAARPAARSGQSGTARPAQSASARLGKSGMAARGAAALGSGTDRIGGAIAAARQRAAGRTTRSSGASRDPRGR